MFLLFTEQAFAEAGKDIHTSDIVMLLLAAVFALFGWQLLVSFLIFYFGNRRGKPRRRKIWGTYGMSLLGSLIGFALVRNGPASNSVVIAVVVLLGIAGALAGYAGSGRVEEPEDPE